MGIIGPRLAPTPTEDKEQVRAPGRGQRLRKQLRRCGAQEDTNHDGKRDYDERPDYDEDNDEDEIESWNQNDCENEDEEEDKHCECDDRDSDDDKNGVDDDDDDGRQ